MLTVLILAAVWLIVAPFLFSFATTALWVSVLGGIVAGGAALLQTWGRQRFYLTAVAGLVVAIAAFFFAGTALWSGLIAGAILAIGGVLAAREGAGGAPRATA
jgi:hypothetical protein